MAERRTIDWEAVEASDDFRELTRGRNKWVTLVGGAAMALGLLYVVLTGVAPGLLGTQVIGSISLGFIAGIGLIVLAWVVTLLYMRRSDAVWGPLEESTAAAARHEATR